MKTLISSLFSLYIFFSSFGQNIVRIDDDCMLDNSIILANIIYAIDTSFIQNMLDENCKILLIANIDSNGNMLNIERKPTLRASNVVLREEMIKKIEEYAIKEKIKFYVCYQKDPPDITIDIIEKNIEYPHSINIGIPSMFWRKHLKYMKDMGIIKNDFRFP